MSQEDIERQEQLNAAMVKINQRTDEGTLPFHAEWMLIHLSRALEYGLSYNARQICSHVHAWADEIETEARNPKPSQDVAAQ